MPEGGNAREAGARIEALLEELERVADPRTRAQTEELIGLLVELYGEGLERILELEYEAGGEESVRRLADDEFVASLLILHGLHPVDVETRVNDALEKVRPYLGSHAGGVEFLGVDENGVAHLRLEGNCDGCPSSTVTVTTAIEGAIADAAPEVTAVEVEGVTEPAAPAPSLIQIEPLGPRSTTSNGNGTSTWTHLPESVAPPAGDVTVVEHAGVSLLLCNLAGELFAYRNVCRRCASPLDRAAVEGETLVCSGCRHRYDIRRAGRSLEEDGLHLDPVPLLGDNGGWKVALPSGALR